MRRELNGLDGSRILKSMIRIIAASAAMTIAAWGANQLLMAWLPGPSFTLQVIRLTLSIGAAILTLAIAAQLLKIQEFGEARDLVLGRFRRMMK
jgi:hypothetical protein